MNAIPNKPALEGRLAKLYAKRQRLAEESEQVDHDIAAVERTLSILPDAADNDRHTAAGDLIIAAGLTDAKRASVIATAHRFMSHSPDWEWTEPGSFRLKAFVPH